MLSSATGKSSLFRKYVKGMERTVKFLSIVSRRTLANEHYKAFVDDRIFNLDHYEDIDIWDYKFTHKKDHYDRNLVIQVDSLARIYDHMRFEHYIVFFDEFNSIIDHIVNSPHIKKHGIAVLTYFLNVIKRAKQVVCVDADLSAICFKVLNFCNVQYDYILNEHKHYQGKVASEIYTDEAFVESVSKQSTSFVVIVRRTQ